MLTTEKIKILIINGIKFLNWDIETILDAEGLPTITELNILLKNDKSFSLAYNNAINKNKQNDLKVMYDKVAKDNPARLLSGIINNMPQSKSNTIIKSFTKENGEIKEIGEVNLNGS